MGHHSTINTDKLLMSASVQHGSIPRRKKLGTKFYVEEIEESGKSIYTAVTPGV